MTAEEHTKEKRKRLVFMAREKLVDAIFHTGDYQDDEIEELVEEALWDILSAAWGDKEGEQKGARGRTMTVKEANETLNGKKYDAETIKAVLEIIDTVNDDLDFGTKAKGVALSIKEKVLALQGGEQG